MRGANYCKPRKAGESGGKSMKHVLVSVSKSVIHLSLQEDLKSHQNKFEYHKRLAQQYEQLVQQTQKKIGEVNSNE